MIAVLNCNEKVNVHKFMINEFKSKKQKQNQRERNKSNRKKEVYYWTSGPDLWKEPSTRSRAFFLEVAISQPKARPSASRIRAFLPGEQEKRKHSEHTHSADAIPSTVESLDVSLDAPSNQ